MGNFRSLTMLNAELKILVKVLSERLQGMPDKLVDLDQTCAVKGKSVQYNLHLIRKVIEKVDSGAALISLDLSKAFDREDHQFPGVVLEAAGFGQTFRDWIRLLYANPGVMVEVNGRRSDLFCLTRSIRQGCPLSSAQYVLALEPFLRKLKVNPVLHGITLPGTSENVRYSDYADDVSVFVADTAENV